MATTPLQTLTLDEKLQASLNIQRTPYIQNADVIDWVQAKFKKSFKHVCNSTLHLPEITRDIPIKM
ncbi:hypothetical protein L914_21447 [Phytophthora nicotianae]|uniref:Uncharacterized protein n=1 Tax=Phytophthora nicotianae TaxID=4792 RepID=W2M3L5_PHYNI|nr:hypothetical protein L914_21447 [Phytophthora nicotianae]